MKQLYFVHTECYDWRLVVRASDADEAERLALFWYYENAASIGDSNIRLIVDLCDNDEIIE